MPNSDSARVTLSPVGTRIQAPIGTPMRDLLFEQGVEFPCGGQGRCRGCRVRVLAGDAPVNDIQRERLTQEELQSGWRLACQLSVTGNVTIELRQWDAGILSSDIGVPFTPQRGLGVAVDVGTTTLVAQLLDLSTGQVLAVRTALNMQATHGADVMSRVQFAVADEGADTLTQVIRTEVGRLIAQTLHIAVGHAPSEIVKVVLVGNTVMHHLFCGVDCEPLSHYPFEPVNDGLQILSSAELGWPISPTACVQFLPCLGGFVGSDILAGIVATGIHDTDKISCLLDLGTNGEIVVGNRNGMLCASTAAGPAFEGARIEMGMRAATGAIWKVTPVDSRLHCEILGDGQPRGICGSGLVDAAAACLNLRLIKPTGRIASGEDNIVLAAPVKLTQTDLRQLQLAKGAIAAGVRLLVEKFGITVDDIERVYLAGAFGNYVDHASAERIGLLQFRPSVVHAAGNTALHGAKLVLCSTDLDNTMADICQRMTHVSLSSDAKFQDTYVEEMSFA